jgi:Pyruvate/2-oxoacid:ferredoxin oxidoreductase gamma subunit
MEFAFFVSGVGGQGVQLMCKVMALAATAENRYAMLSSDYGGQMRGGSSLGTVVVGNNRLRALPVVPKANSAIALHHLYWELTAPKLRPNSLIVVESSMADDLKHKEGHRVIAVPAVNLANEIGNPMSMGLIMLGAYNAITGLVSLDSLVDAMKELVPSYRRQHIETNERALRIGAENAPVGAAKVNLDEVAA